MKGAFYFKIDYYKDINKSAIRIKRYSNGRL